MRNLEVIKVENLRPGGCIPLIKKRLYQITGVKEVTIVIEKMAIVVEYEQDRVQEQILRILLKMGYPQLGSGTFWQKLQSYLSCFKGRFWHQ